MYKRYEGSFVAFNDSKWTVRIFQENTSAYTVEDISECFSYDNPLEIEWKAASKSEVICGSSATLRLLSPSDRKFLDLYSIRPGQIRLDVLKDDVQYWSGCLDPEHSEEPYDRSANYEVTLNFSDFGILKRLKYNLTGLKTLAAVLSDALTRSKVNYTSLNQTLISTALNGTQIQLSTLAVRSDNFYDEEDKPMTLYDVVQGVLRPLALRMIQRAGNIYIFDLNALYNYGTTRQIVWASTGQTLGMDKVYNNITVTFSPYGDADPFPEFKYTGAYSPDLTNYTTDDPTSTLGVECYTFHANYKNISGVYNDNVSFTIFVSGTEAKGIASKGNACKYFHTEPLLGGSEMEGVALFYYVGHVQRSSAVCKGYLSPSTSFEMLTGKKTFLPKLSTNQASKYRLRLNLKALVDARYNPFEDAGDYNEQSNYDSLAAYRIMRVPVLIQLYNEAGTVIAHYTNSDVIGSGSTEVATFANTTGTWEIGAAAVGSAYLTYYEWGETYSGGLRGCRQAVSLNAASLSAPLEAADDGQYMPYPAQGGYIEVKVCAGIEMWGWHSSGWAALSLWINYLRWCVFGGIDMSLVKSSITNDEPDTDDIEYSGEVNADAEEELSIDTVCGTMSSVVPTARGLLFVASTQEPVTTLTRQGRTACPEQLLIGTLLSQHADRMNTLAGVTEIIDGGVQLLTDANLMGKVMLLSGDVQNVRASESEITAIELAQDEYVDE